MGIRAEILNDSVPAGKNFDKAAFRLWYPEEIKTLAGIIVLVPGSNGDGRGMVQDLLWQALARKHNFALMGCYYTDFQHEDMVIENYANVKEGSGQALLDVLDLFAVKSGHPELADAPLLMWGHSAGGEFNYEFVCWKPERVLAFVVNKGGVYFTALASLQARNVPGILFTGEKDLDARRDIIKGIFSMNRRVGALWIFAEEPGAGHEIGQTQKLAIIFFDEIIPLRLNINESNKSISKDLLKLSADSGFIGDNKSKTYYPVADCKKADHPASWLPGPQTAGAWLSFIKGETF